MKQEPVEKFKISANMNDWLKQYRKMLAVGEVIQNLGQVKANELAELQDQQTRYTEMMKGMHQAMPRTRLEELHKQEAE